MFSGKDFHFFSSDSFCFGIFRRGGSAHGFRRVLIIISACFNSIRHRGDTFVVKIRFSLCATRQSLAEFSESVVRFFPIWHLYVIVESNSKYPPARRLVSVKNDCFYQKNPISRKSRHLNIRRNMFWLYKPHSDGKWYSCCFSLLALYVISMVRDLLVKGTIISVHQLTSL